MIKVIIKAILQCWLIISMLIALMFFNQIFKDRKFKEENLVSPQEFVESFKRTKNKLPTIEEFKENYFNSKNIDYNIVNSNSEHYEIEVWRGEWFESYSSKSNIFTTGGSGICLILIGIKFILGGILPLLLFQYIVKRIENK